jgi:hypothetical protein
MFRIIGVLVALYTLYALVTGSVWAKAGISAREILRQESPGNFWTVIVIYTALSVALIFYF